MQLNLVGLNHQTAPVTIRERVAISAEKLDESLALLRPHLPEAVILSTCNRTEIYAVGDAGLDTRHATLDFLKKRLNLPAEGLSHYLYIAEGREAADHLFRVASGLASMIVGEYEVLGQVRQSFEAAEKAGMVDLRLRTVFQSAIRAGRRVREETAISKNALSVSSVAIELAAGIVGDLTNCRLLVIGAGEAGRLVAKMARERGTSQIVIANRTRERAQALAEALHGIPVGMEGLPAEVEKANIIVTCAASPHRILEAPHVEAAMKNRHGLPLVIIDIALPRNVDPDVAELKDVHLYDIDSLTEISDANRKQRQGETQLAERIVREEAEKLEEWWRDYEIRPIIASLMSRAEEVRSARLNKTLKKLRPLSDEERQNLEAMTQSIVTRILKEPMEYLKSNGNGSHCDVVRDIFQLEKEAQE